MPFTPSKYDGNDAIIEHADPTIPETRLTIGPQMKTMTDRDIVDVFNGVMAAQQRLLEDWDRTVTEIPPGKPQIEHRKDCDQWAPRGEVLRCIADDGGPDGEVTIHIDNEELSLAEFGKLLLKVLKDIELLVIIESETLGIPRFFACRSGRRAGNREKNSYAVELARATVWIGEIQWMLRKGFDLSRAPVLSSLPGIIEGDAILNEDTGEEPHWPAADVIVGNPPFMGSKFHLRRLGTGYVEKMRECYQGRVPAGADLVCYWFEKARAMVAEHRVRRVGLLATKSIATAEPSRQVLDRIIAA